MFLGWLKRFKMSASNHLIYKQLTASVYLTNHYKDKVLSNHMEIIRQKLSERLFSAHTKKRSSVKNPLNVSKVRLFVHHFEMFTFYKRFDYYSLNATTKTMESRF